MSSIGYRTARLAEEAQERLRSQQTQRKARSLLKACKKKLNSVKEPIMQQLLQKQIHSFKIEIDRIQKMVAFSVDSALYSAKSLQQQINTAFSKAEIRAKQIQLENLKKQAGASLNDTTAMLRHIHDPALQQLIGPDIRKLQPQIKKISDLIQENPKKATAQSNALQKQFNKLLDQTQNKLEKEADAKADARAKLENIKQQFEAAGEDSTETAKEILLQAQTLIDTTEEQYKKGRFKDLEESCIEAQTLISKASEKDFDETVRKEVVQGLLTTLSQMGFVVQPPYLDGEKQANQTVRLLGELPSGKMAAFNVHLDGRMEFDFDGYEGRACAKELEKIDEMLNQQFSIQFTENKITWKNPDKIAKGAMQLPSGNRNIHLR